MPKELHPKVIRHRVIKYLKKADGWISYRALANLADLPKEGDDVLLISLIEELKKNDYIYEYQVQIHKGLGYYSANLYKITDKGKLL